MRVSRDKINQLSHVVTDALAKRTSQKKNILEGSDEWDILYRKYYMEELKKLGV